VTTQIPEPWQTLIRRCLLVDAAARVKNAQEAKAILSDARTAYSSITEPKHFNGAEIPIAHGIDDSMSFSEAFAKARQEIGAGGVFEWHKNVYGIPNFDIGKDVYMT
jgi:hypothetical protein